jgi:DNA-directed RNA polymerase specialized sigma24 family protein
MPASHNDRTSQAGYRSIRRRLLKLSEEDRRRACLLLERDPDLPFLRWRGQALGVLSRLAHGAARRKSKPKPETIGEVRELRAQGMTVEEIADELSISVSAVRQRIRRANRRGQ